MFCSRAFRLLNISFVANVHKSNSHLNHLLNNNSISRFQHKRAKCHTTFSLKSVEKLLPFQVFKIKTNLKPCYKHRSSNRDGATTVVLLGYTGILSFLNTKEEEKESELITTIKRAILLIQKEELKVAEQMLHVALKLAQEQQNSDGITYVYDLLANIAFELGEYTKAEKLFKEVMERALAGGMAKDDVKIVHMSLKLAKIYEEKGEKEKAETGFQFCIDSLQPLVDKSIEDEEILTLWAMSLDWYARFLQQQNRMDEALVNYKKAYNMCVKINGEVHEQNVVLLNDIGTISYLKGDKDGAVNYMTRAIEIGKHLPNMEDFSSVYVNLGNIYLQKGMYEEAKKSCTEGFQNATRHKNTDGLKEAKICLEEIKKVFNKK